MKIYFNEEHILLRDMVREFAINEIRPHAQNVDTGQFPTAVSYTHLTMTTKRIV